jgi:branched-chain amino acid aminotransferase
MKIELNLLPPSERRREQFRHTGEKPLSFGQKRTDHMCLMYYDQERGWHDAKIVPYGPLPLSPGTMALHYAQEVFEGAKAHKHADGEMYLFRFDKNALRLNNSLQLMQMPTIPPGDQMEMALTLLDVERLWYPDGDEDSSMYIRPFVFAAQDSLGVHPSSQYIFCMFLSPSGPYFNGGFNKPSKFLITEQFKRVAPGGLGKAKTGGNYAASLRAQTLARRLGADQVLYLNPDNTELEECGSNNHVHVTKDGRIIIPSFTPSILESITTDGILELSSRNVLGNIAEQTTVGYQEFLDGLRSGTITEAGGLGTAAVVTPVGSYVLDNGTEIKVGTGDIGEVTRNLFKTYTGVQKGRMPAPEGWLVRVPRTMS